MANLNKLFFMGHLTRDVELAYTPNGTAVGKFGMASNRKWNDAQGNAKEEVVFVDFTAWGKQAETLSQWVKRGAPLFVEGRLKLDQWEDKTTGAKRQKLSVVVEAFQFLPQGERKEGQARPATAPPATAPADNDGGAMGDDDVPF